MSYHSAVLADSPSSYLKLDETSGSSMADAGSNGYTGTQTGLTLNQSGPSGVGAAPTFDSTDRVDIGDHYPFTGTGAFTISAWIYRTSTYGTIISKVKLSSPYTGWIFGTDASGSKLLFERCGGSSPFYSDYIGADSVPANQWVHVAVTYDGTSIRFYQNGVIDSGGAITASRSIAANTTENCLVGNYPSPYATPWQGKIAALAIWNGTALSGATLAGHYAAAATAYTRTVNDALGLTDAATKARVLTATISDSLAPTDTAARAHVAARALSDTLRLRDGTDDFNGLALATSGIDSLWKLDEVSGSTIGDVKGGITGTKGSGVTLGGGELFTGAGRSATFADDPTNAVVDLGDHYKLSGTENFSIEAWFRSTDLTPTGGSSNHVIGAYSTFPFANGWRLVVLTSGKVAFLRYDAAGNSDLIQGSTTLVENQTYLIGVSYDGTTVKLYVNGVLDGSGTSTRSVAAASSNLKIGASNSGVGSMVGRLGPIAKYSRALDATEFAAHYTPSGGADVTTSTATAHARTISDPLGLTDARAGSTAWSKTDTLGLTDAVSYEIGGRRDWITISDSVVVTQTGSATAYTRTISDSLGFLDPRSRAHAAVRSRDDTLGLSDAAGYQHLGNVAIRPFFAPLDVVAVTAPLDVVAVTAPLDLEVEI